MPSRASTGSISSRKPLETMTMRQPRSPRTGDELVEAGPNRGVFEHPLDDLVQLAPAPARTPDEAPR